MKRFAMEMASIIIMAAAAGCNWIPKDEKDEKKEIPPEDVLSVAQAKQAAPEDSLRACVCGIIIGGVKSNKVVYADSEGYNISANILIADKASDSTLAVCLPVELKTAELKAALSLTANPSLAGKKVRISGTLLKYFNTVGLKAVTGYEVL